MLLRRYSDLKRAKRKPEMQPLIDLRSDTVTRPSPEMRGAMAQAEVGDDVFGEDPTVRRLEAHIADMLGKEAALFVPSGTMGNQLGIRVHCQAGDEFLCESNCHVFVYEQAAYAQRRLPVHGDTCSRSRNLRSGVVGRAPVGPKSPQPCT